MSLQTLTNALEILTIVMRPLQAAKISKEDTSVPARVASNTKQGNAYNCDCKYHISDGPFGLIFLLSVECSLEFN